MRSTTQYPLPDLNERFWTEKVQRPGPLDEGGANQWSRSRTNLQREK